LRKCDQKNHEYLKKTNNYTPDFICRGNGMAFIKAARDRQNFVVNPIYWCLKCGIASFPRMHACVIFAHTSPVRINKIPFNHL
jgi:hypothetical protein